MGSISRIKRVSLFLIVFSILVNPAYSYPIIISNKGVNHKEAKQLVYSIPEKYYKYVNVIEFVNKPIKKFIWETNNRAEIKYNDGQYWVYWDKHHKCLKGKILIYSLTYKVLMHELGHIADYCINLVDYSTEEFANNFQTI